MVYSDINSNEWTKQRLDQMIADGVEEGPSLEYKRAASIGRANEKKIGITKDISAFANASGGVLIYGIAEFSDDARCHLPERLDPIQRTEFSREWLDQIIQRIQPRIEGLIIRPVTILEQDNTVCYVVEVPQSDTAHMSLTHCYHKRYNFTALPMEDYEVRDVMNRRKHPKILGSLFINRHTDQFGEEGLVLVRLENVGRVIARELMVDLELPIDMKGLITPDDPSWSKTTAEGSCRHFRLFPDTGNAPIFPGSYIILRRKLHTNVSKITDQHGNILSSSRHIQISIFADEMPPIRATMEIEPVLNGWTPVQNAESAS